MKGKRQGEKARSKKCGRKSETERGRYEEKGNRGKD
jgi:hypothetical protein